MDKILATLEILRPLQWYKNLVLVVPLIFSLNLFNYSLYFNLIFGVFAFNLIASGNYIINDILDLEKDLYHPQKKKRPLASKRLSIKYAYSLAFILLISGLTISFLLDFYFALFALIFLSISNIYNLLLREIIFLDVLSIASNFVVRGVAGAFLIHVKISPWLIIGIYFVALYLSFLKRRYELEILNEKAKEHRKVLIKYNKVMLDHLIGITSTLIIISYSIYSISNPLGEADLILTLPLVIFLVFRGMYLVYNPKTYEMIKDKASLLALGIYFLLVIFLLYF